MKRLTDILNLRSKIPDLGYEATCFSTPNVETKQPASQANLTTQGFVTRSDLPTLSLLLHSIQPFLVALRATIPRVSLKLTRSDCRKSFTIAHFGSLAIV